MTNEEVRKHAQTFLEKNIVGVLATADRSGAPSAATMYYAADDHFNIYFLTSRSSRKFHNLSENSRVSFVIGTGPAYVTVQGAGVAHLLSEKDEEAATAMIAARVVPPHKTLHWPILKIPRLREAGTAVFKIVPDSLTLLNLDEQFHPNTYKDDFHQIIPAP